MIGQFSSSSPGSILCFALSNAASHSSRGVLHALLLRKDSVGNLEVTMRWAMEAGHIAEVTTLFRWGFADWANGSLGYA